MEDKFRTDYPNQNIEALNRQQVLSSLHSRSTQWHRDLPST